MNDLITQAGAISSPLSEAEPQSLDELFSRFDGHIKARTLSLPNAQKDLASIVIELRRQAEVWAKAEAAGATKAPRAKGIVKPTTADDLEI